MKQTPLYDEHIRLGGRIIDFGGWALPVQYSGITQEHEAVRNAAGLFDVSHMGEVTVKGRDAQDFIQRLVTNDISKAVDGQAVYSPMCYPDGGVVDDLIVYRLGAEDYLLVVNAANTDKDFEWICGQLAGNVQVENVSSQWAQLALQGPKAQAILQKLTDYPLSDIRFFHFVLGVTVAGFKAFVSRGGYTGEDGFELYAAPQDAPALWKALLPAALGARDTLRFEAALPLYGQEISADISPLEAGLNRFVKLDKADFIGKAALVKQAEEGLKRRMVGFEMVERGIPRSHYDVQMDGKNVGFVTTGSFSPTLKKNIGLALVEAGCAAEGTELDIIIRDKPVKAHVIPIPFYNKKYKNATK
ncbi:MAG: glycine cleavage system aminomethyltransferase GcvT [Bacillota bacterium]